jgi:hypothetical protein
MSAELSSPPPKPSEFCGPFGQHLLGKFQQATHEAQLVESQIEEIEATLKPLRIQHRARLRAADTAFKLFRTTPGAEAYLEANQAYCHALYCRRKSAIA